MRHIGHRITGRLAPLLTAAACILSLAGAPVRAAEPLQIVATIAQIGDLARNIGGEHVQVTALMGEGVDPHSYRLTRSDVVKLHRADMVLYNGLYLEAQMEAPLERLGQSKQVVAVAEAIPAARLRPSVDYAGESDPHVWMDVERWRLVAAAVRDALIEARPDRELAFRENFTNYDAELADLADYARQVLTTIPESERALVTAHDAFNYFGEAYGFDVVGIQGISTESEAGLKKIEGMVDLLVERRIRAVFSETSVSERNVRALIEGAGARGHEVVIGGTLFSDAMGSAGTYEGTYIGMIDHNVTVIATALGGTAPARGFNGRLTVTN